MQTRDYNGRVGDSAMKYDKSVFKSLALITQLGINVLVPTAVCVGIGVLIDRKFDTYWVIPLMILGMLAGGRNAYRMAMAASGKDSKKKRPNRENKEESEDEE